MKRIFVILLPLLLQVVSPLLYADHDVLDEVAISQQRQLSNNSIAERDVETFLGTLMPDYHVVTSANLQLSGHAAQRELMNQVFSKYPDATYVRTLIKLEINSAHDTAAESGSWAGKWEEDDKEIKMQGSYFAKWRKVESRWLLQAEIFVAL